MGTRRRGRKMKSPLGIRQEESPLMTLQNVKVDFDCGAAVWLHGMQEMSNEVVQFLNLRAMDYGCISQCFKFRLKTKRVGVVLFFGSSGRAVRFCEGLADAKSPHQDFPFRAEHLGVYLRIVAHLEQQLEGGQAGDARQQAAIVIRNLSPSARVSKRVLDLCSLFGPVLRHDVLEDAGQKFRFRHLVVRYGRAVSALSAQLGLDGKWIAEQPNPLAVDLLPDEWVKAVHRELLKHNKLIFQPYLHVSGSFLFY